MAEKRRIRNEKFVTHEAVMQNILKLVDNLSMSKLPSSFLVRVEWVKSNCLIHSCSRFRSKSPFIAVNCAAIPSSLLESELFGYKRERLPCSPNKIGQIEAADGGTFLLDEISEISLDLQENSFA